MQITKEFLQSEINDLERESEKARTFLIQTQAVISTYRMLIQKIDTPEEPTE